MNGTLHLPPAESLQAGEVDPLFYFILYVSAFFFFLVTLGTLWFAWRYRNKNNQMRLTSGHTHNNVIETIWTVIPTILVIVIFFWGWKVFLSLNLAPAYAEEISVRAVQWKWQFNYPNGAQSEHLVVPVGKPVRLTMTSGDVLHSLFIPDFRVKMDVVPNRYTSLWFQATNVGEYDLFCTEYCGLQHSKMLSRVEVKSTSDYEKWLGEQVKDLPPIELGQKAFSLSGCNVCHVLDGGVGTCPNLNNKFGTEEHLSDGSVVMVDENYIRESILEPNAKIVKGYEKVPMPSFKGALSEKQIEGLIAFIKSRSTHGASEAPAEAPVPAPEAPAPPPTTL
jgi:cytochrome c oxidase subunit II